MKSAENRQAILPPAGIQGSEGFGRGQQKYSLSVSAMGFGFSLCVS